MTALKRRLSYARPIDLIDLVALSRAEFCELTCTCGRELEDRVEGHEALCLYPGVLRETELLKGSALWIPEARPLA